MKIGIKALIKALVPPVIPQIYNHLNTRLGEIPYGWFGNFTTWEQAITESGGYDAANILLKVKESLLKVKNGEAVYERDSVIFSKIEYSWPLLASLMWIAAQKKGHLNLIDFGGSLGSSYYQNKIFLDSLKEVRWNIVEQPSFTTCGKENFSNEALQFFETIEQCSKLQKPDSVIFSSVLQYLENPYDFLESILGYNFEFILFDLMPFNFDNYDRLTVQKVNPFIYEASYPCWILNKQKLLKFMDNKYELVAPFDSKLHIKLDNKIINYEGILFRRRNQPIMSTLD